MPSPLLFVGDIHLGRSPHRLAAAGLKTEGLGPAEAWRRVVRYALGHEVQAVVLAGDVVDQDKDRFEAWSHLREGVTDLIRGGVRVIGVAGNHDHIALPRLADRIEGFTLLGRGGHWERIELDQVDLVGWSFPARHHTGNPLTAPGLDEALARRRPRALTLGVLHADLDAADSPYAPVRRDALTRLPVTGWFLGHVHQPGDLRAPPHTGYLGSLVGLDRGETGPRGPWSITPTSATTLTATQVALGPVYWADLDVDTSDLRPGADTHDQLHTLLESRIVHEARSHPWLLEGDISAVGCTIRLVGRTRARAAIRAFLAERRPEELVFEASNVRWAVVRMVDATLPTREIHTLAHEHTPLGQVARLLVALEEAGATAAPPEVLDALRAFDPTPWATDIQRDPLPPSTEVIRSAALHLLDQLLSQREPVEVGR